MATEALVAARDRQIGNILAAVQALLNAAQKHDGPIGALNELAEQHAAAIANLERQ